MKPCVLTSGLGMHVIPKQFIFTYEHVVHTFTRIRQNVYFYTRNFYIKSILKV